MTQAALARKIGIDRTVLAKIESGSRRIGAIELADLARGLGVPIERLFEASGRKPRRIDQVVRSKRAAILRAAKKWGASNVRVFGSVATGTAGPDSDVDFLVDFEPDRGLMAQAGLALELEEILGCKVDLGTPNALCDTIRNRILREAVPL